MGVGALTTRLNGSITAIAAMATVSASLEWADRSCLYAIFNATGQTLHRSSVYAPAACSSFDLDLSMLPSTPAAVASLPSTSSSTAWASSIAPVLRALPTEVGNSPSLSFSSQPSSIRFHSARRTLCPSGMCHLRLPVSLYSTSRVIMKHQSPWSYCDAAVCCQTHAFLFKPLHIPASFLGSLQGSQIERMISSLYSSHTCAPSVSAKIFHTWNTPNGPSHLDSGENVSGNGKPTVAVVLLGWLGAQQKHLKKYADWYTSRGIHAVTFVVPMMDILSFKAGDKAEKHVDSLTQDLMQWLTEDSKQGNEKYVIFHTFSNTGWLAYGAILERLINEGDQSLGKIKGCVVDSAPSARPDPQVWASGFSAALLKKGSVTTQNLHFTESPDKKSIPLQQPSFKEMVLVAVLEKFFSIFLQTPYVNRRLNDVISVLSNQQPSCPQLYIYSTADTIIPASSVEAFIEEQKKAGRMVSACNFKCSPHVDHFRTFPEKYSDQLTRFIKICIPQWPSQ